MPPAQRLREIPDRAQGAERLLPGGNLPVGCPHPAQLQRQLPAHAARRLRAAGRRRLVSCGGLSVCIGGCRGVSVGQPMGMTLPPYPSPRSHHSGEVPVGAFCRVAGAGSGCPCALSALEEQNFLFQLQAPERPQEDTKEVGARGRGRGQGHEGWGHRAKGGERAVGAGPWGCHSLSPLLPQGLEVPLVAVVQWSTPKLPFTSSIYTHYRLPSIRLDRPRFVMTAACESPVPLRRRFTVTYTLLNNLQDFLAVRLVWTPESATAGKKLSSEERRATQAALDSIVCHTPLNSLGYSRKGSALTIRVAFQALRAGLFELSQHMKLKLQFTASVSNPPPDARPISRRSSPGSPAVRDLVERHQAGLGRSQSFSHQQPSRSHLMRSGSVMERRAITPPVGSPVGRPLYLPPEKSILSLDKIAKRECKVLVVEPIK
uniref:Uncharacterized protein n=1 Tax=Gopherus evgoodei TaxID=1825980 RepID=A0A8C5F143_9SAUR